LNNRIDGKAVLNEAIAGAAAGQVTSKINLLSIGNTGQFYSGSVRGVKPQSLAAIPGSSSFRNEVFQGLQTEFATKAVDAGRYAESANDIQATRASPTFNQSGTTSGTGNAGGSSDRSAFSQTVDKVSAAVSTTVNKVTTAVKNAASTVKQSVTNAVSKAVSAVKSFFSGGSKQKK
jgi:hypothetical protein